MKKPPSRPRRRKPTRRVLTLEQMQGRSEDIRRAYFEVFGSDAGRLVLEDMETRYCIWKGTLPVQLGRPVDPISFGWAEGRRSVVLDLYELIEDGRQGTVPEGPT